MAERDPVDKISDVSQYGPTERKNSLTTWMVNIPIAIVYKAFRWLGRRKRK